MGHFGQKYRWTYPVQPIDARRERVANDICPECGGPLDTGWECNECGFDAMPLATLNE